MLELEGPTVILAVWLWLRVTGTLLDRPVEELEGGIVEFAPVTIALLDNDVEGLDTDADPLPVLLLSTDEEAVIDFDGGMMDEPLLLGARLKLLDEDRPVVLAAPDFGFPELLRALPSTRHPSRIAPARTRPRNCDFILMVLFEGHGVGVVVSDFDSRTCEPAFYIETERG